MSRNRHAFRRRLAATLAPVLGLLAIGGTAVAQDQRPGRYTITPANGGFIRLDTETGATAFCKGQAAGDQSQWQCTPMGDGQQALQKQIEDLKAENKALRDELKRMEDVFVQGGGKPGEERHGEARPGGKLELPSEQDVDKAFDYFEKMMKKLRERMRRLEKPDDTAPEKPGKAL